MWEQAHVGFGGTGRQRNGLCIKQCAWRDAPKVAILKATCVQNALGRSTMCPPEALPTRNSTLGVIPLKRAEYGFGEYGFKPRTQWVFWPSPSSGERERAQWVAFGLLFVSRSALTEFCAELTEFPAELSEHSYPKLYSRDSIPPFPILGRMTRIAGKSRMNHDSHWQELVLLSSQA